MVLYYHIRVATALFQWITCSRLRLFGSKLRLFGCVFTPLIKTSRGNLRLKRGISSDASGAVSEFRRSSSGGHSVAVVGGGGDVASEFVGIRQHRKRRRWRGVSLSA